VQLYSNTKQAKQQDKNTHENYLVSPFLHSPKENACNIETSSEKHLQLFHGKCKHNL